MSVSLKKSCYERVLGIDLGIARTGYGIVDYKNNKVSFVTKGCLLTVKDNPTCYRINLIYNSIVEIVKLYKIKHIVIERVFHNNNSKTINVINQIHGIVLLVVAKENLTFSEYTPIQVKQCIFLDRNATKKQMISRMIAIFLESKNGTKLDDAFDGLACAYSYFIKKYRTLIHKN